MEQQGAAKGIPPPVQMLPRELRQRLNRPHLCAGCGESFGIVEDWADLLARVDRHLQETDNHGNGL
jgi:hypothetical protein